MPEGSAAAGYAEADPAFDIEGNDTAHKLSILTTLAFGNKIAADDIYLEGITNISIEDIQAAAELGYRIKLLGVAQVTESGIEQRVHPTMVPLDSVIAQVDGVTMRLRSNPTFSASCSMVGPGAGGNATASAVLGDIADIAKSRPGAQQVPVLGRPAKSLTEYRPRQDEEPEGGYFIRLTVRIRAGVFASIATRMGIITSRWNPLCTPARACRRCAADHHPRHPRDDGRCDPQGG